MLLIHPIRRIGRIPGCRLTWDRQDRRQLNWGQGESGSNVSVPQAQPVLIRTTRDRARQLVHEPNVSNITSGLGRVVGGIITTAGVGGLITSGICGHSNVYCDCSGGLGSNVCSGGVPSDNVSNLALSRVSVNGNTMPAGSFVQGQNNVGSHVFTSGGILVLGLDLVVVVLLTFVMFLLTLVGHLPFHRYRVLMLWLCMCPWH